MSSCTRILRRDPPAATPAAFVSAGGYHHHLGINVWNGRGVDGPPPRTVGLRRWTIQLPTEADVSELRERLARAGKPVGTVDGGFEVRDPWNTALAFVSEPTL